MMTLFMGRVFGLVVLLTLLILTSVVRAEALADSEKLLANTSDSQAPGVMRKQGIRAQITSLQRITLSSEMPGRITRLKGLPGDRFKKGSMLVSFDCTEQKALLRKAQAMEKSGVTELAVQKRLLELDAGSTMEMSKAEARLAESRAEVSVMKARVSRCQIKAPFAGRVAQREASEHEYVRVGTPLLEVFAKSSLEIRLIVPSRWLAKMKKGDPFQVAVEETGRVYAAEVIRTGAVVDPISQSVEIAGRIKDKSSELLPGMSGWARLPYE